MNFFLSLSLNTNAVPVELCLRTNEVWCGMELDEDCLVRVGRAGAGGAGVDAQNPAQKEPRETRCSSKQQWTEKLAVVDAHLC